jgi:hypothetical protein
LAPLEAAGLQGLQVLPYVRNRLVFADLAVRLLKRNDYEIVLVDFPYFMNSSGWLEYPFWIFPLSSLAIFGKDANHLRGISFAPNDAASIAVYLSTVHSLRFLGVDDSDLLNYPPHSIFSPAVNRGDDYQVYHLGLEKFFQPIWKQMTASWSATTAQRKFFSCYRAQVVTKHLREAMQGRRKGLFICEYQLWWALQRFLHQEPSEQVRYIFKWEKTPGVLRVVDSYLAWVHGFLDDYPAVNLEFWKSLLYQEGNAFDKLRALEKILSEALIGNFPRHRDCKKDKHLSKNVVSFSSFLHKNEGWYSDSEPPPQISPGKLASFFSYLRKLMVLNRRLVPDPGTHLFYAAQACGGRSFQENLVKKLLRYPRSDLLNFIVEDAGIFEGDLNRAIPDFHEVVSFYTGRPFSSPGGQTDQAYGDEETTARKRIIDQIQPGLTLEEQEELLPDRVPPGIRWEVADDFRFQALACRHLRFLVRGQIRRCIPKKSWRRMQGGLHWKAILGARARGERAIYIKHRTASEDREVHLDDFTPVVFLFAPEEEIDQSTGFCVHDSNLTQRHREMGLEIFPGPAHPAPDKVYSVFFTSRSTQYLIPGHIQQENLTSLCSLYNKKATGLERYNAIIKRRPWHQCRQKPMEDPALKNLPLSRQGIAWAIKYAKDTVIVAAPPAWQLPRDLQIDALNKGIKLITISLLTLKPEFIDRLSRCFFLSTGLKRHPRYEEIVRRFIH